MCDVSEGTGMQDSLCHDGCEQNVVARAVEAQRRVEARERRAGLLHSQEEATKPGAADAMPRGLRGAKPREAHMYEWLQARPPPTKNTHILGFTYRKK